MNVIQRYIAGLVSALLIIICLTVRGSAAGLDGSVVVDVKAKGSEQLSERQVLAVTRLKKGDVLNPGVVNEDIKRIWKMGLFDGVSVEVEELAKGVSVTYVVAERPSIKEFRFTGNKEYSDKKLLGKTELEEGQTYDSYKVADAVHAIEAFYKEKDYYSARITVKRQPSKEKGKVILVFTVEEGVRMKIEKVEVTGNVVFSDSKIRGAMKDTKASNWFNLGGSFDRDLLKSDLEQVLRMYVKEGYLKAKIEGHSLDTFGENSEEIARAVTRFDEESRAITISFKVEEGIQYRLTGLEFEGNEVYKTDKLAAVVSSQVGEVFNQEKWEKQDIRGMRTLYANKGYIFADATPYYTWDDEKGEVKVKVKISEGHIAYIEKIKIVGNEVTKEKVIRRVLSVAPGEAFDAEKLQQTQRKITNLGFFENVAIDTQPGSEVDKLILVIDVSPERKTGTLSLGAGFSSVEGLVGFLQVSQNNLFGNGQAVSAQWDFGDRKRSYSLSFTEPWLFNTPTSFGIDVFRSLQSQAFNSQGYDLESTGGSLRLGRNLTPKTNIWKVFATYRYASEIISDVDPGKVNFIAAGTTNISSITPSLVRDTRDNIFDPTEGTQNIISWQYAGGFLGGDNNFTKPVWDSRAFFQTPAIFGQKWLNRFVLGLHGRVGFSEGFNAGRGFTDVPPSERFFMGGTDTVRGYHDRRLGASATVGGRFVLLTNIEYGFKPAPPFKLRVFYDAGNTWVNPQDADRDGYFLYPSWGFGMLFTIPTSVIQIRLDWGFPLVDWNTPDGSGIPGHYIGQSGGKIHFNIGNIF